MLLLQCKSSMSLTGPRGSIPRLLCIASIKEASGAAALLQGMAQAVRQKAHRKRALQKGVRWQVGDNFEITVSLYILFSKARVPTSVMVEARTLAPTKREAALICADSGWSALHWLCPRTLAQESQILCCCEFGSHSRWPEIGGCQGEGMPL